MSETVRREDSCKETKDLEHVATPAMKMIVVAAKESFTEEQLFWLSEEFDVLAHEKFRERISEDESWMEIK